MTTILCIEDEAAIRQDIVEELEDAGYATHEASDGEEGLAAIRKHPPDLVLCDITMPRMDGYALVKQLRAHYPQFSELPFIFLSALADRKDVLSGIELGADDYLTKPIDFELLLAKVEATLRWVARMRQQKEQEQIKLYKSLVKNGPVAPPRPQHQEAPAAPEHKATAVEEQLKGILRQGTAGSAGRLHFINLSEIKTAMGDDWDKQAGKAMLIAETVINRHLTKGAVCNRHETDAFFLLFPDLSEEEAVVMVETIANEIAIKLLGEDYSSFRHLSLTATAKSMGEVTDGGGHLTEAALAAAFEKHAAKAGDEVGRTVDVVSRMLRRLIIGYQPVWHRQNERVLAYHARPYFPPFEDGYADNGAPMDTGENPIAADIDLSLIAAQVGHPPNCGSGGGRATTILPIHYQSFVGDNRKRLAEAFQGIAKSGQSKLVMIEIVAIPESADFAAVQQAIGMPKEFSYPVVVRGSPHQKFATWARKAGAAFLSLNFAADNTDDNRPKADHRVKNFADGAKALGLKPYVHGLNTMGAVKEAIAADIPLLAGPAIGRELDLPGEIYDLRKERFLTG